MAVARESSCSRIITVIHTVLRIAPTPPPYVLAGMPKSAYDSHCFESCMVIRKVAGSGVGNVGWECGVRYGRPRGLHTCMIIRKVRMAKVTTIMITAMSASIGDPVT